ncbi:hypothetical protein V4F39_20420 [Aquincola sp. MAHUQ-54]|uniref:Uncharacterized protein n=1 Tax=Aquincola agrisoli TaxID=3119538 RepID=A0AAW9QB41_9BURK
MKMCSDCERLLTQPAAPAHGALARTGGETRLRYLCAGCGFGWTRHTHTHSLESQWLAVPQEPRHQPRFFPRQQQAALPA